MRESRSTWTRLYLAVGLVGVAVTIISWAAPDSREWMLENAAFGWISFTVLALGTLILGMYAHDLRSERDVLQRELDQLELTPRDRALLAEVEAALPWDRGIMGFVEHTFAATTWEFKEVGLIHDFLFRFRNSRFYHPDLHRAFVNLYSSLEDLSDWMAREAHPTTEEVGTRFTMKPGTHRVGGWAEHDREQKRALELALAVRRARARFGHLAQQLATEY